MVNSSIDPEVVKTLITMEQVLEHYGLLRQFNRHGDRLIGRCPLHRNSTKTDFRVNIKKNTWQCLGECKHGGDTLTFITIIENIPLYAAAMSAVEWFNLRPSVTAVKTANIS